MIENVRVATLDRYIARKMRDLTEVIIVQLFLLETILMRCKNDMKTSSRKNYERRDKHE